MTIRSEIKRQVRERANFACEYCGVSEIDAGGEWTIDHFKPQSHGGGDELDNLVYACMRCNLHKADYWLTKDTDIPLWNPRQGDYPDHFFTAENGVLHAITEIGALTINRLQLNRGPLVAHRARRRKYRDLERFIELNQETASVVELLAGQEISLLESETERSEAQQAFLKLLARRRNL